MTVLSGGDSDLAGAPGSSSPPVPGSRVPPGAEPFALLLWLRCGSMTVRLDHRTLVARPGQAVWLPPGTVHSVELHPGSVAVPFVLEPHPRWNGEPPRTVVVPDDWTDWLLVRLARSFGFSAGPDVGDAGFAPLLRADAGRPVDALPRPVSSDLRQVVEGLLAAPRDTLDLDAVAASVHLSRRTLQRRLRGETGLSWSQWRTEARVRAAIPHLRDGRGLEWTAHEVGYAGLASLSRAFRDRRGVSPGRYLLAETRHPGSAVPASERGHAAAPPEPAPSPTMSWVSMVDGLLWVHRGRARAQVGGRHLVLAPGDVVLVCRGWVCRLAPEPGAVVLPLGMREGTAPAALGVPVRGRVGVDPDSELALLHTVVANHFLLQPEDHDDQAFWNVLPSRKSVPSPGERLVEAVVRGVVDAPTDERTLADWARSLAVPEARLRRELSAHLGLPFARWRRLVRMTHARSLLWEGQPAGEVARDVGYADASAFSRAFTGTHGLPPREWVRQELA